MPDPTPESPRGSCVEAYENAMMEADAELLVDLEDATTQAERNAAWTKWSNAQAAAAIALATCLGNAGSPVGVPE